MGDFRKFFIPAFFLGLTLVVFQNCGQQSFHGNGDPYENNSAPINLPGDELTPEVTPITGTVLLRCQNPTTGKFSAVTVTTDTNGKETIFITQPSGASTSYSWSSGIAGPLSLNRSISYRTSLVSAEINSNIATVVYTFDKVLKSETLNCQ